MARSPLPKLVRFLMVHAAIGFGVAGLFTVGLIYTNPTGIGMLLSQASNWPLPTVLLWFLLGLTSSSCQMGAAIMLLGNPPGDDGAKWWLERARAMLRFPDPVVGNKATSGSKI